MSLYLKRHNLTLRIAGVLDTLDPAGVTSVGTREYDCYASEIAEALDNVPYEPEAKLAFVRKAVELAFHNIEYPEAFYAKASEVISYML